MTDTLKNKIIETKKLTMMGFGVILLKPNAKSPLHSGWQDRVTKDEIEVKELIKANPDANIGITTGEDSGVIILDFDVKKNAKGMNTFKKLEQLFGDELDTLTSLTPSGGFHKYFKYPKHKILKNNRIGALGGLDIKTDGGLVVTPPATITDKRDNM